LNILAVSAKEIHVHGLPMGQAGLMDFDFIPVGPLAPRGMLIAKSKRLYSSARREVHPVLSYRQPEALALDVAAAEDFLYAFAI
jgi:hypothetical protein